MKARSDKLISVGIEEKVAQPLMDRLGALERMWWMRQGSMPLRSALLSAYLQGVQDCATLAQQGKFPTPQPEALKEAQP